MIFIAYNHRKASSVDQFKKVKNVKKKSLDVQNKKSKKKTVKKSQTFKKRKIMVKNLTTNK